MWLSLPALFTQFIVPRLLTVASADPNSHMACGISVISQFGADRNHCTDVCYFMHKKHSTEYSEHFFINKK